MSKFKVGSLLEIWWMDAIGQHGDWSTKSEYDYEHHEKSALVQAVGYFLKQNNNHIYVSQVYRPIDEGVLRVFSIPTKSIIKVMERG
jgi:hypothetical protein